MSYKPKMSEPIKLDDWRSDTGYSQKRLAEKLSVSQNYISQIETGKITPGETFKAQFRNMFPGYDVIEMRADYDVEEEAVEQESASAPIFEHDGKAKPGNRKVTFTEKGVEFEAMAEKVYVVLGGEKKAMAYISKTDAKIDLADRFIESPDHNNFRLLEAELR